MALVGFIDCIILDRPVSSSLVPKRSGSVSHHQSYWLAAMRNWVKRRLVAPSQSCKFGVAGLIAACGSRLQIDI